MFSATHFGYGRNFKSQTRVFGRDNESQKKNLNGIFAIRWILCRGCLYVVRRSLDVLKQAVSRESDSRATRGPPRSALGARGFYRVCSAANTLHSTTTMRSEFACPFFLLRLLLWFRGVRVRLDTVYGVRTAALWPLMGGSCGKGWRLGKVEKKLGRRSAQARLRASQNWRREIYKTETSPQNDSKAPVFKYCM